MLLSDVPILQILVSAIHTIISSSYDVMLQ